MELNNPQKEISLHFSGSGEDMKKRQIEEANKLLGEITPYQAIVFGEGLSSKQINKIALYKEGIDPFTIAKKVAEGLEASYVRKRYKTVQQGGKNVRVEEEVIVPDLKVRADYIKIAQEMTEIEKEEKPTNQFNILINNDPEKIKAKLAGVNLDKYAS